MRRKLTLDLDALSVHSFDTTSADGAARGTVLGAESPTTTPPADDCTCDKSCACPSAYFYCNTGPAYTNYSCNYTKNASCLYSQACTPPMA
ncbi:MAG TPA: hypothetical protein VM890_10465 [Longimicrobium sp.]|jgi:hypothetical protein|nr:hypothetical protein [Longimicrobium sp.]